jgi:hypothetical protein
MNRSAAALALLAGLAMPAAAQEEALGRLFFTPQQRAAFDRERLLGGSQRSAALEGESSYVFNGEVRRSSGRNTRWFNGEAQEVGGPRPPVAPGDTWHPATGERESVLGEGQTVIRRRPATP